MSGRRVAVLFGDGMASGRPAALGSGNSPLATLLGTSKPPDVVVVSLGEAREIPGAVAQVRLGDDDLAPADRLLGRLGAIRLRALLARSPLGRLLNSVGPIDPSRVFWRALSRHPEALALVRSADVVIAADLAAVKTAWIAVRRGWVADAHYDHRAALLGISLALPPRP
jgi:hypothetical protein